MIGPWPGFEPGQTGWLGPGPAGRLFLRPPTLTAGNFAALWPTDPKFLALKDLNPFKTVSKVQKTSSILRVGFALSKWPHLHRAYVVGGCLFNFGTVNTYYVPQLYYMIIVWPWGPWLKGLDFKTLTWRLCNLGKIKKGLTCPVDMQKK